MKYAAEFLITDSGESPAKDFLEALDDRSRRKFFHACALLEAFGTRLRMPFCRSLGEDLYELRFKGKVGAVKAMIFVVVDQRLILAGGYLKKKEKAPAKELDIARERKDRFLEAGVESDGELYPVDHYRQEKCADPRFARWWKLERQKLQLVEPILAYRLEKKLTQVQLAQKAGVRPTEMSEIENGELANIAALEKVLRCIGHIVEENKPASPPPKKKPLKRPSAQRGKKMMRKIRATKKRT